MTDDTIHVEHMLAGILSGFSYCQVGYLNLNVSRQNSRNEGKWVASVVCLASELSNLRTASGDVKT